MVPAGVFGATLNGLTHVVLLEYLDTEFLSASVSVAYMMQGVGAGVGAVGASKWLYIILFEETCHRL